jgi:iron complex transport system ATP-binding protein
MPSVSSGAAAGPILALRDVSFGYGERPLIDGMTIEVRDGDFMGILGPNGSGKTTVLRLMGGMLRPLRGRVGLWGHPIGWYPHRDRAKLVSYLPQVLDLAVPFTVRELAGMGQYPYRTRTGMTLDEALDLVGLGERGEEPVRHLSGGERRRAFIAMTLLQGAGIVLLDEPLANLDIRYQGELLALLARLNRERGLTVVLSLHEVGLAFRFGRVALLSGGAVVGDGFPAEVLTEERLGVAFETPVRLVRSGGETFVSCL